VNCHRNPWKEVPPLSDEKKAYIRLALQDFTIIDRLICYSAYDMEAEPAHRVLVNAKGIYDSFHDRLELNGRQIDLDSIQIQGASTKEDCLKSHARHGHIAIYMIDSVFSDFVDLVRGGTERGEEIVMTLDAQPHKEISDVIRLSFDGIDMTRNVGVSSKDEGERLLPHIKRSERLLFTIAVMTGLILLHFLFR
jgi:hypothetical protein